MTSTVIIDGLTVTFGDTDGNLAGSQHGGDQNLGFPAPDIYVGDANALLDQAVGGNDTLNGLIVVGDAFTITDQGRGGDDVIRSGSYSGAVAYGDAETMSGAAVGGNDSMTVAGAESSATGYGDAARLVDHAQGGDDTLSAFSDHRSPADIYGDARDMSDHTVGGDDRLTGPDDATSFTESGDALALSDHAQGGDDTLETSATVFGGGEMYGDGQTITDHVLCGNDSLSAPISGLNGPPVGVVMYGDGQTIDGHVVCGNDTFSGTAELPSDYSQDPVRLLMYGDGETLGGHSQGGDDVLVGGREVDLMWGDAAAVAAGATTGADRFEFSPVNGHDQVMDFESGKDVIALAGFGFTSFQDLASHFQATPDGVLISFDADDDILVHGVTANQLSAGDFILS